MLHAISIVVAAGQGNRMGSSTKKQFLRIKEKPMLIYTLEVMERHPEITGTILVVSEDDLEYSRELIKDYSLNKIIDIVPGGDTRGASVYNGLKAVPKYIDLVVVHDGARPFLSKEVLDRVLHGVKAYGAAVAAVPVKDTIKETGSNDFIEKTLDRSRLWAVQTPQAFLKEIIVDAYQRAAEQNLQGTDDASLVEAFGHRVKIVMGDYQNIKITTKEDLDYAEYVLG
ncbi:MAG: 2-C-methyl-D-erythritol 4-phosphate cytidylyltransferase [Bacillota bacterium]